jgi:O-6-methylguanine DNA methyltransferase
MHPFPLPPIHRSSTPPNRLHVTHRTTRLGPVSLLWSDLGLVGLTLGPWADTAAAIRQAWPATLFLDAPNAHPLDRQTPWHLIGTPYQQDAWLTLSTIPWGETRPYKHLANHLGTHARPLGQALARNPLAILLPCHRVLPTTPAQAPGGYRWGPALKQHLLDMEASSPPQDPYALLAPLS